MFGFGCNNNDTIESDLWPGQGKLSVCSVRIPSFQRLIFGTHPHGFHQLLYCCVSNPDENPAAVRRSHSFFSVLLLCQTATI